MITIQRVKNIADEHIFSTIAISLSLIFAIIPSTICFATFWLETKFYCLLFFIPTLALILICYLINLSNTKIIKIILVLVNLFIIFVVQTFFAFGLFLILSISNNSVIINNPSRYTAVIKEFENDEKILHFPSKIPMEAKNKVLFKETCGFQGGDIVYLKFVISKEYILNEIKKHNYIKIEGPFDDKTKYTDNYPRDWIFGEKRTNLNYPEYRDRIEGYKIYVIGNEKSINQGKRPCEYGIAVNEKTNTIIYYASNPD